MKYTLKEYSQKEERIVGRAEDDIGVNRRLVGLSRSLGQYN